jgi:hypothetical protein
VTGRLEKHKHLLLLGAMLLVLLTQPLLATRQRDERP